ncbi:nineteen complex-related protein 2-domain-containing protein [Phyllosticta capitalensis]|uniref:nineteen complex-related protein 2-domain-containing protein n=1 Tax=Phyllosticta capitalensis TaxID=121624 RepID=UPI003130A8E6
MKKSFGSRRVPRKIGQDDDDDASTTGSGNESGASAPESVVKRPPIASKSKKRSSLRLSFGPGEGGDDGEEKPFTPKKSNLSRIAAERNAERRASGGFRASLSSDKLPSRPDLGSEDRPSYSKEALAELRDSTPTTPKDLSSDRSESGKEVDIAAKFGPLATTSHTSSAIPTDTEIREKKERRARLAQEKESGFISLDDRDEEHGTIYDAGNAYDSDDLDRPRDIALRSSFKEKYPETRLVRDDEDFAEGFEEYVEDGRINLGRKAEREAERKRRKEMASMIAEAEGGASADEESDDSEAERNAAYEAAQTRKGTYGQRDKTGTDDSRPRTPPKISPLPELGGVLARIKERLKEQETIKVQKVRRMQELVRERADIEGQEKWIQEQLKEAGEKYEKLRIEAGSSGAASASVNGQGGGAGEGQGGVEASSAAAAANSGSGTDTDSEAASMSE